ncbi:hypothetical protein [Kutzneria sp. 744]|uniref:hypothetical protein n=1 Tax=Kutzneria sp. (strain 744) TaxID=345341 RepID=UPI0003EEAE9F|nr:hypothetical protein [Kutzneria sp. 744]EWM12265.1 serine/arginine repetitive matrix protein 1 [Kutzneria sp. 744]
MNTAAALADFTGTTLYVDRRTHPEHGLVHVLGYQNTAANLAVGPNAMLLHLPAVGMSPGNLVSVGRDTDFLDCIGRTCQPVAAAGGIAFMDAAPDVQVFEHDIYTMVLAADATLLPSALHQVESRKRPRLNDNLLAFYADYYPDHALLLCHKLRQLLPAAVIGQPFPNGDFAITHDDLLAGVPARIRHLSPAG